MQHYYAVAEPDEAGGFWISFPGRDRITSAASSAIEIVAQARNALESVLMYGFLDAKVRKATCPYREKR